MTTLARAGQWYLNVETGQHFEIVAIDEHSGTLEIQYVDGDLDELDAENWSELPLHYAAEPEDARAGFAPADGLDEQLGIETNRPPSLINPLDALEGDSLEGIDDY